jgi:hypothetical protein
MRKPPLLLKQRLLNSEQQLMLQSLLCTAVAAYCYLFRFAVALLS